MQNSKNSGNCLKILSSDINISIKIITLLLFANHHGYHFGLFKTPFLNISFECFGPPVPECPLPRLVHLPLSCKSVLLRLVDQSLFTSSISFVICLPASGNIFFFSPGSFSLLTDAVFAFAANGTSTYFLLPGCFAHYNI